MAQPPSVTSLVRELVTSFYRRSHDFNGIPYSDVLDRFALSETATLRTVRALIRRGEISAVFGDIHPNAHIRALPDEAIETQLAKLASTLRASACLYPTERTLESIVDSDAYADKPFTRRLVLGEPQLAFAAFDLAILEFYRNDPRYLFEVSDAGGHISILDEYFQSSEMADRDQVLLQSFGFCYGPTMKRAVGVFLRYLSDLSPEHQQLWQSRILTDDHKMHPDYWASSMGHWPEGASIFHFVLAEMDLINEMAAAMGRGRFFKQTFKDDRPVEFTFLLRPTRKEFDTFVQTLDKMLSDNIDTNFFRGEIEPVIRERKKGVIDTKPKGSITMLQEWVNTHFRSKDPSVPAVFKTLRRVRELRSHPSHNVRANAHDEALFDTQRALMVEVYRALETLRLILAHWPETVNCDLPRILRGDTKMWTR